MHEIAYKQGDCELSKQTRLFKKEHKYNYGPYNKFDEKEQWIRITEGCPHDCAWCYEPTEIRIFKIPEIVRNQVKIMDMNLLCKPEALEIIRHLGSLRVDKKVVYYELVCGIDYRFLTQEIALALHECRFKNIRLAWDKGIDQQVRIKEAVWRLMKAGYQARDIMVFMVCNHESISQSECCRKLDLLKVWGVSVADCYYDNQTSPNIIPIGWKDSEIKLFRHLCRKHNQLVSFGIDPEVYESK